MSSVQHNETIAQLITQCGGDPWGSCAQYPISAWRHAVDEGSTLRGYWDFVLASAEADGLNLANLTGEGGRDGALDFLAQKHGWTPVEIRHARESLGNDYGTESVIPLANGRLLCCPAHPSPCYYVRVTHMGYELANWSSEEFREDTEVVLGALLGAAKGALQKTADDMEHGCRLLPEFSVTEVDGPVEYVGTVRTSQSGSECNFSFLVPHDAPAETIEDRAAEAALAHVTWTFGLRT